MRFLIFLALFYTNTVAAKVHKDILVKSRFDLHSSRSFIDQLRSVLSRNGLGDPYNQEFDKTIVVDLGSTLNSVPEDTQKWISELQTLLDLQLFESEFRLVTEGLGYSIEDFNSDFLPLPSKNTNRVEYVSYNYVKALTLKARRIAFEVELKKTRLSGPITFQVELLNPKFHVSPELTMDLHMGWTSALRPENLTLTLHTVNLHSVFQEMVKRPELINFEIEGLKLPEVSIQIGDQRINLDHDKIQNFLSKNRSAFKAGILDLLHTHMNERFSNVLKDSPVDFSLPRKFEINNLIHTVIELQDVSANHSGILQFGMNGLFCDNGICHDEGVSKRNIGQENYRRSSRALNRRLIETSSNLAVSVSEDFLNRLLEATIRANLWEKVLADDNKLGPMGAFVLADEKGDSFSLYLDIIHRLKGTQRIMVGRSELRFPVRLKIVLLTEEINGTPHFKIQVREVATSTELLLKGVPEYGLETTIASVSRFRNKVLKNILEDVMEFRNKTLVDLELPELKGTIIEQVKFSSDGMGRANATLNF